MAVVVTSISPAKGSPTGGDPVLITGSGFTGATTIKVGTTQVLDYVVASDTEITAHIHSQAAGITDVTVGAVTATGIFTFGVADVAIEVADGGGVVIKNESGADCYVGQNPLDPTLAGIKIASTDEPLYLQAIHGKLYAACASGNACDLRVLSL